MSAAKKLTLLVGVSSLVAIPIVALGGSVGDLNVFGEGHPPRWDTLNQNFRTIKDAVNGNAADIGDRNALQTTTKASLVDAINEVRLIRAPAAPYVFAGPAVSDGPVALPPGYPNLWAVGATLMTPTLGHPLPKAAVAGKSFSGTFSFETKDSNISQPGAPILGGQLVIDLFWQYDDAFVVQPAVATFTIDPGVINRKSATFTGVVPVAPATDNQGFVPQLFQRIWVVSGAGTTAQSNAKMAAIITVEP